MRCPEREGKHSILIVHKLGKDLALHPFVAPRHFGGECHQRAAALSMIAVFQA